VPGQALLLVPGQALLLVPGQALVQAQALLLAPELSGALQVSAHLPYCNQPLQMKLSRGKAGTGRVRGPFSSICQLHS